MPRRRQRKRRRPSIHELLLKVSPGVARDKDEDLQTYECAKMALDSWNKDQKSKGMPPYVLVGLVGSVFFRKDGSDWWHANFKARPVDDAAAEPELFFVEEKGHVHTFKRDQVTKLCVLGPSGSGLNGCIACDIKGYPPLDHPESGFNIGQRMPCIDEHVHEPVKAKKLKTKKMASTSQ